MNFSLIFSPKIIPISRIFDEYERFHPFVSQVPTIFAADVLYRTYNVSPSARVCISDTTYCKYGLYTVTEVFIYIYIYIYIA